MRRRRERRTVPIRGEDLKWCRGGSGGRSKPRPYKGKKRRLKTRWCCGLGAQRAAPLHKFAAALAGPEGAVVPVDAVAAVRDDAGDDGAVPIGGELAARIPGTGRGGIGFVGDAIGVAASANGAALRTIAAAVPRAFDARPAPAPSSATVVAASPKGAVRPVDLGAVGRKVAGDELPSGSAHYVGSLKISRRGVTVFVGQRVEDAVAGDRGLLVGIALRAPLPEECGALISLRRRSRGVSELRKNQSG